MKFSYTAFSKKGKKNLSKGTIEAKDRGEAKKSLEAKKLSIVSLSKEKKLVIPEKFLAFFSWVRAIDKVMMAKHLSIMLRAGLTIDESLEILKEQTSSYKLKSVLSGILKRVEAGYGLADSMELYPNIFSAFFINMVRVGEEGGTLVENLERLAERFSKDFELRRRVRSAMLYPVVILTATVALGMAISLFVLPRLSGLFRSLDYELPLLTRMLIRVSTFLRDYGVYSAIGFVVLVVFLVWLFRQKFFYAFSHKIYLKFPIVKTIIKYLNLSRFAYILGTLLKSGLPITDAVKVTSNVLENYYYSQALAKSVPEIEGGLPFSDSLSKHEDVFPPVVFRMVSVGEKTGNLEETLLYLGEFYEAEVDSLTKNLATVLEPVLLIIIGIIVGGVAIAVISPVYNFLGSIG